ncbi:hypothetical protein [Bacteroides sp. An19]|uniref:hypothetical protein n=2 Tax=Bacteroides TaxID=816 RepID=UPI0013A61C68|nr:hypothetical protein [Bacteroides sp. An19]
MIWDEFLRHFRFCDEEDSGLSDEEQERKGPKNRPKHTRKRIHQAKKNFLEKFKTASYFAAKETFRCAESEHRLIIFFVCFRLHYSTCGSKNYNRNKNISALCCDLALS